MFSGASSAYQRQRGGGPACCCFCPSPRYIQDRPRTPSSGWCRGLAALPPARWGGGVGGRRKRGRESPSEQVSHVQSWRCHTELQKQRLPPPPLTKVQRSLSGHSAQLRFYTFLLVSMCTRTAPSLSELSVLGLTKSTSVIWSLIRFQTVR